MTTEEKIVLYVVDASNGCIATDFVVSGEAIPHLEKAIGSSLAEALDGKELELSPEEAANAAANLAQDAWPAAFTAYVRPWRRFDGLPYKIHTDRELNLMLEGSKPLAAFVVDLPDDSARELIPERFFDPYVAQGLFTKRQIDWEFQGVRMLTILYAIKGQDWRIDAWLLLKKTARVAGWSEGFERMEGSLLGYEDWQNDAYIDLIFKRKSG